MAWFHWREGVSNNEITNRAAATGCAHSRPYRCTAQAGVLFPLSRRDFIHNPLRVIDHRNASKTCQLTAPCTCIGVDETPHQRSNAAVKDQPTDSPRFTPAVVSRRRRRRTKQRRPRLSLFCDRSIAAANRTESDSFPPPFSCRGLHRSSGTESSRRSLRSPSPRRRRGAE